MKRTRNYIVLIFVALAALWSLPPDMRAQSNNQAALVVRHGDNDVRTACIEFDEPHITGYELLQRSGAELQLDAQGIGALVCSIDDTGCPPNDCLCQCKGGGECVYWSYWHRLQGTWQYSQGGASVYDVEPGAVEGWSWGPGAVNQAVPPPDLTFEDVCQSEATDTPTPTPSATIVPPVVVNTPLPAATGDNTQPATATASPTAASTATALPSATADNTATQTPLRQQSTATAVPTVFNTPVPTETMAATLIPAAVPSVLAVNSTPQDNVAQEEVIVENAAAAPPAEEIVSTFTPAPAAAGQQIDPARIEATPGANKRKIAAPAAEPTVQLQVIGEGVVPTTTVADQSLGSEESSSIFAPETTPYLAFLLIIAGLTGLLGFVSWRRRQET
jgi:hypothetical protein